MNQERIDYLKDHFAIDEAVVRMVEEEEEKLRPRYRALDEIMEFNQYKVLKAFQDNKISDSHFFWHTGYGYDDPGRQAIERVYADLFQTEAALVRPTIVNGTHALSMTLMGILRPGDELIYCTGKPYDTLEEVVGLRGEGKGSLKDYGVTYRQVELTREGTIDLPALKKQITSKTKMVSIQRATGYGFRRAITMDEIQACAQAVKSVNPQIVVMADNCYGEFLETKEPTQVGVDVMAGSLIKNPGGGLALAGGYVVGKKELIEAISYRMTCPGIGGECGLMFGQTRTMLQGLFLAPKTVNGAMKAAILCGGVFSRLGYGVCPKIEDPRADIIQAVELKDEQALIAFCQGVQKAAPIDAHVMPLPWDMPGYEDPVIMAAGAFVQGSSIELSADAPIREPYIAYFQGGLTYEHGKLGVMKGLQALMDQDLLRERNR